MIPLAFAAIGLGAVILIAGMTGSSVASVAKGHPDRTHKANLGAAGGAPAGLTSSSPAASLAPASSAKTGAALKRAITQLGVPYQWGGEAEKIAFDCSGLVQWAFSRAGVRLPRTAQEQYGATHRLSPGEVKGGDLVFFGSGGEVSHVGIVVHPGLMIDAPHTGATVRYETFPQQIGSAWGTDTVVGYGRA